MIVFASYAQVTAAPCALVTDVQTRAFNSVFAESRL